MLMFIIMVAFIAACIAACIQYYRHPSDDWDVLAMITGFIGAIMLIACFGVTAVVVTKGINIDTMQPKIEQVTQQRDDLLDLVADELSTDEYQAVLAATGETDISLLLADPSKLLIARVGNIIALNDRVYALDNRLLDMKRDICGYYRNLLVPRFPFFGPGCDL
jgi:hypothetical protein